VFRILAFAALAGCLFILPDRLASPVAVTEGTFAQRYAFFSGLSAEARGSTAVFIGSSQTLRHVVPSVIAETTGSRAFNLGHRGLRTVAKVSVARQLLAHVLEPGATLVIEDGVIAEQYLEAEPGFRDTSLTLYTTGQFIDDMALALAVGERFRLAYLWRHTQLYWFSRFKAGVDPLLKLLAPGAAPWSAAGGGYVPFTRRRTVPSWPGVEEGRPPRWFRPEAVDCETPAVLEKVAMSLHRYEQLEAIASRRGVRLLIHAIPRYRYRNAARGNHAAVKDCVFAQLPPHRVIDLRSKTNQQIRALMAEPRYFQNAGHLNGDGARRYSRALARILKDRVRGMQPTGPPL